MIYTAWFVGWIGNRSGTTSDRFLIIAHTLFPLFCPPTLWFSVRTFTGMFMLAFSYLKVAAPVITYKCITELEGASPTSFVHFSNFIFILFCFYFCFYFLFFFIFYFHCSPFSIWLSDALCVYASLSPLLTVACVVVWVCVGFRHIYNSIFSAVFIAVLIYPVMNRHMDIRFDEH